jgi:uncharacterized Zn-binding protein involved in type VI secretion
MPNALVLGISTVGGGILINNSGVITKTQFSGSNPVVLGGRAASHGAAPHALATMVQASSNVFVANVAVCREGHLASCAHPGINGTSKVIIN